MTDARRIRGLGPKLRSFLSRFDACFPREDAIAHLPVYISGRLSDVPEKSVEPIVLKYFVSNASIGTSIQSMRLAASSRWRVERRFEDQESEFGLDHYEGRRPKGRKRRLILSRVSYLILTRMRREIGGGNPDLTECRVRAALAASIPFWWLNLSPPKPLLKRTSAEIERTQRRNPEARRRHTKRTRRLTKSPRCK